MNATHLAPCDAAGTVAAPVGTGVAHPGWTLAASILGSSLAFIDGSIVNVALPAIGAELEADAAALAWTINAYMLPLAAMILLGGALGDHLGRRRMFLAGTTLFLLASLLCALAPSLELLLAGRALQGLGGAMLMPNSLASLGAAYEGEARGRAIGTWAASGAVLSALSPLLSGWLVETIGWRAIFLINLPVGAAAMLVAWRFVTESRNPEGSARLDWSGALLATAALGMLAWALTAASEPGRSDALPGSVAGLGTLLLGLFVWVEWRRGDAALMPFGLFSTRTFAGLTLLTFFLYAALGGLIVILPFLLIRVGGYSAIGAGAAMLPVPLLIGIGSRLMGGVAAKIGGRLPLSLGAAIVAVGLALFLRVTAEDIDYWTKVLPAIVVVACGMAVSVAPLTTSVIASVDSAHVGVASGFNSAVARIGGLIATALLGFVFASQGSRADFVAAVHVAAMTGAAFALVASVSAFLLIAPKARNVHSPSR